MDFVMLMLWCNWCIWQWWCWETVADRKVLTFKLPTTSISLSHPKENSSMMRRRARMILIFIFRKEVNWKIWLWWQDLEKVKWIKIGGLAGEKWKIWFWWQGLQKANIYRYLAFYLPCYMWKFAGAMTLSWSNMQSERYDCDGRLRRKCSSRGPETWIELRF